MGEFERIALLVIMRRIESGWLPCQLFDSSFHTSIWRSWFGLIA